MVGPADIFLSLVLTNDCCLFIAQLLLTSMGNCLGLMMITISLASHVDWKTVKSGNFSASFKVRSVRVCMMITSLSLMYDDNLTAFDTVITFIGPSFSGFDCRSQRHQNGPNEICVFSVRSDPVEHKPCKPTVTLMQSWRSSNFVGLLFPGLGYAQ